MSLIDFVRGQLVERGTDWVVVAVGGFGMRILMSPRATAALPERGTDVMVHTFLQVREDALTLYGFASSDERATFLSLITVTGVGPKVALAALAAATPEQIAALIAAADAKGLAKMPGIGTKTAQRIVLELKGKLPEFSDAQAAGIVPIPSVSALSGPYAAAEEALRLWGYSAAEAGGAVAALPRDRQLTEEEAIRMALAMLAPAR